MGLQDQSASQESLVPRGLKGSLARRGTMEYKEFLVRLGAPDQRAREDRKGPQVYPDLPGPRLTSVMQENQDPWVSSALRDPLAPQVLLGRKVKSGKKVLQVLALKALKVNQVLQVYQGTQGPRALLALLETQDCQDLRVRKV